MSCRHRLRQRKWFFTPNQSRKEMQRSLGAVFRARECISSSQRWLRCNALSHFDTPSSQRHKMVKHVNQEDSLTRCNPWLLEECVTQGRHNSCAQNISLQGAVFLPHIFCFLWNTGQSSEVYIHGHEKEKSREWHLSFPQLLSYFFFSFQEFQETCHSVTFYFMKKRLQTML